MISSLNIIHKITLNKKPKSMTKYFKNRERERKCDTIVTTYIPISAKMNDFYIYKFTKIYNKIDLEVRSKKLKGFKNEIKLMTRAGTVSDTMDWIAATYSFHRIQTNMNNIITMTLLTRFS